MTIIKGDSLEELKKLQDNSIDAIVTDPPYGLSFMGKKWDYDVPSVELWSECFRVLKPGGYLLSFAGTRTQHRMAVRIEDAGFEIRDMIAWVYGSGFPKSLNIGKAVDKLQGIEVEKGEKFNVVGGTTASNGGSKFRSDHPDYVKYKAQNEFDGWGTALKPALEPITVARKPIEGTVAENCLKWGVGGINIDGCRVGTEGGGTHCNNRDESGKCLGHNDINDKYGETIHADDKQGGRFPANLIHDGSEEVLELFPETKSGGGQKNKGDNRCIFANGKTKLGSQEGEWEASSGSAARFFKSIKDDPLQEWAEKEVAEHREEIIEDLKKEYGFIRGKSIIYQAKASKSERNMGLDGFEEKEMAHSTSMKCANCNLPILSGTGVSCECEVKSEIRQKTKNFHPTVKPIKLMEYLIKLVSKEGHTVLDPFAGSGTTGIACKKLNRNFIGIEREEDYVKIAEARINAV